MTLAKPVDRETYARHTRNKLMMNPTSATAAAAAVASIPTLNPYAQYLNLPTALAYQPFVLPNVNPLSPQNFSTANHAQQPSPGIR